MLTWEEDVEAHALKERVWNIAAIVLIITAKLADWHDRWNQP